MFFIILSDSHSLYISILNVFFSPSLSSPWGDISPHAICSISRQQHFQQVITITVRPISDVFRWLPSAPSDIPDWSSLCNIHSEPSGADHIADSGSVPNYSIYPFFSSTRKTRWLVSNRVTATPHRWSPRGCLWKCPRSGDRRVVLCRRNNNNGRPGLVISAGQQIFTGGRDWKTMYCFVFEWFDLNSLVKDTCSSTYLGLVL